MCLCSILQKLNEFVYGRHDTSVEQVDHPVGEARIVFGVCHHNNGGSFFVQFGQELHHFGSVFGVQVTGRLIGKDDFRIRNNGTGDGDTLLLTSGKLLWKVVGSVADVHALQDVIDHLLALACLHFEIGKRQLHVFKDIQFVDQIETLEHETDISFTHLRTFFFFQVSDFPVRQVIVARCRVVQQAQDIQQGGLATAGRAHDCHKLTILHFHRHAVQRDRFHLFRTEKLT